VPHAILVRAKMDERSTVRRFSGVVTFFGDPVSYVIHSQLSRFGDASSHLPSDAADNHEGLPLWTVNTKKSE
jgi:hypothetical protein